MISMSIISFAIDVQLIITFIIINVVIFSHKIIGLVIFYVNFREKRKSCLAKTIGARSVKLLDIDIKGILSLPQTLNVNFGTF